MRKHISAAPLLSPEVEVSRVTNNTGSALLISLRAITNGRVIVQAVGPPGWQTRPCRQTVWDSWSVDKSWPWFGNCTGRLCLFNIVLLNDRRNNRPLLQENLANGHRSASQTNISDATFVRTKPHLNGTSGHLLGHSFPTFGPEFPIYTRTHAFTSITTSHRTVKVHDVTAEHRAPCTIKSSILFTRWPRSEHGLS